MKPEPYVKVTNANSEKEAVQVRSYMCVPVRDVKLAFECDRDGRNLFARAVCADGSYGCLVSQNDEVFQILSLKAASVSEFWLKAYASNCVFEEDETAPSEPEKEIVRLKTRIKALEDKIRKYKDTMKLIYSKSENF